MVRSKQDKTIEVIAYIIMALVTVIVVYPFILLFMSSITDEKRLFVDGYSIFPKQLSLGAYEYIWAFRETVGGAYFITIAVTAVGTTCHIIIVALASYPLSLKTLPGRSVITFIFLFIMLFNGGLVPTYMFYTTTLHIKNTFFALIVPGLMFSTFNTIICRTYIAGNVPNELYEAAKIDGASEFRIWWQIVLPLSKSIFVTIGIFSGLGYWNNWTNGLYYVTKQELYSIQQLLNTMVKNIQYLTQYGHSTETGIALPTVSLRMAIAFVGMLPILILYPFLQKYFQSGITLGAVKG